MLTVIIDARTEAHHLPALLAQLTAGAVDGIVRQVLIAASPSKPGIEELCEESGAGAHAAITAAAQAARADWIAVLPADFRLRDGWIGALKGHLERGQGAALVQGWSDGGLFSRRPFGVLVERSRLQAIPETDLKGLRRSLRLGGRRTG
jgi:molybdopterin-guanine dinucleotide biosynthesis protein A